MTDAIQKMRHLHGRPDTSKALQFVREEMFSEANGDRPDVVNVVIIVTDGSSVDRHETVRQAVLLKQKAHVIVVQVGNWVDKIELHGKNIFKNYYKGTYTIVKKLRHIQNHPSVLI